MLSYIRQHSARWLGLTSGALSVGLMVRAAILSTSVEATLFWIGAYVTGGIASIVLWQKEHLTAKSAADRLRAELQEEIADVRAENAKLLSQLESQKKTASQLNELNQWIERGNEIAELIRDSDGVLNPALQDYPPSQELGQRVKDWGESATTFVAENYSWFKGQFESDAGMQTSVLTTKHRRFSQLYQNVNQRIKRFAELLDKVSRSL